MMFDKSLIPVYIFLGLIVICMYACFQQSKEVDRCFMQEPRTKECELVLYRYENRPKNRTTVMPMPVVVR